MFNISNHRRLASPPAPTPAPAPQTGRTIGGRIATFFRPVRTELKQSFVAAARTLASLGAARPIEAPEPQPSQDLIALGQNGTAKDFRAAFRADLLATPAHESAGDWAFEMEATAQNLKRGDIVDALTMGVTVDQLAAIHAYTGGAFGDINAALREGRPSALAPTIAAGLSKLPAFKGSVYRYANLPEEVAQLYQPGETIVEKAFTSTTANPDFVFEGEPKEYTFAIKPKEDDTSARSVWPLSKLPEEREVLFPPGAAFKVLEREGNTIYLQEA